MGNSVAYSFREERAWDQSVPHTYEGRLLFTETSIRNEIAKEKWAPTIGPVAAASEGGTHTRLSFELFPNFHESEKFHLKKMWYQVLPALDKQTDCSKCRRECPSFREGHKCILGPSWEGRASPGAWPLQPRQSVPAQSMFRLLLSPFLSKIYVVNFCRLTRWQFWTLFLYTVYFFFLFFFKCSHSICSPSSSFLTPPK